MQSYVCLTDLVGESDITSLVQRIRKINTLANLKRTEYGKVNLDYVLGIGGFDLERAVQHNNHTVGMIKTLVFHTGKAPRGDRTDWVMHEYRLEDKDLSDKGAVQVAIVSELLYVIITCLGQESVAKEDPIERVKPSDKYFWFSRWAMNELIFILLVVVLA
ncbi:hypothetical protein RYX36_025590 [Vicia faba]